jgi:argininosuccinate lyase
MMPQKRNPDPLEVMKAKTSVAHGLLASLLSIGKALFLGYNRDTQWTKYLVMDLIDECLAAPPLMGEIIVSLKINPKEMAARSQKGFITAPELVEQMVREWKIPFRQAKGAAERAVRYAEKEGAEGITLPGLRKALQEEGLKIKMTGAFLQKAQEARVFIAGRAAAGGPSPRSLDKNISSLEQTLQEFYRWLKQKKTRQSLAQRRLAEMEKEV